MEGGGMMMGCMWGFIAASEVATDAEVAAVEAGEAATAACRTDAFCGTVLF
jgi:hypothetical protein